jgi:AcrR family transcriptional regulator
MAKRGRPRVQGLPERRREQILAAATESFARRGFPGTDLQDVADALRLGKATVYRYFPTKKALFLAAADRGMRLLLEFTERAAAKARAPLERVALATEAYLRFYHERPEFVELLVQERAEFRDRPRPTYFLHYDVNIVPWRALFRDLMRRGVVRPVPVARITDVFSAALYGAILTNYFEGRRRPPGRQAREILDVLFRGILGPRAGVQRSRRRTP